MSYFELSAERVVTKLRRNTVVFFHAGRIYNADEVLRKIKDHYERAGMTLTTSKVFDVPKDVSSDLLVLMQVEDLVFSPSRCEVLANLRSSVLPLVEEGLRVLMVSAAPKRQLQGCPGSSLILDAAPAFVSGYSGDEVRALSAGIGEGGRRDLWSFSQGLPLLVDEVLDLLSAASDMSSAERVKTIKLAVYEVLCATIAEAGPEFARTLDYYTKELRLYEIDTADLDGAVVEGWRGAGVATSRDGWTTVELFPGSLRPLWDAALRAYVDSTLDVPSEWESVSRGLWEIERRVRESVRVLAEHKGGKGWRGGALSAAHAGRAVERARADAFPSSSSVEDLPNPFEWLTLAELVETIEEQGWARPAGVPLVFWRNLQSELFPVRNRMAHMRLLRPGDAETVCGWLNRVRRVLG